jgi:hypothetical protein
MMGRISATIVSNQGVVTMEMQGKTRAGSDVYSYDTETEKDQVFATIRKIVREDVENGKTRQVYVISGTHGALDGTVNNAGADIGFKEEDLRAASITRSNINIRNYHELSPNRWQELSDKKNAALVLAWCYSYQWTTNDTPDGNNGKLVMQ